MESLESLLQLAQQNAVPPGSNGLNALMQSLLAGGGPALDARVLDPSALQAVLGGPHPQQLEHRDNSGGTNSPHRHPANGHPHGHMPTSNGHAANGHDSEDQMEATEDMTNASKSRIREKNRHAQRRFRERQRTLVKELRVQVDLLCRAMRDKQEDIARLQHENRLMKALLIQYNSNGVGAPVGPAPAPDGAPVEEAKGPLCGAL